MENQIEKNTKKKGVVLKWLITALVSMILLGAFYQAYIRYFTNTDSLSATEDFVQTPNITPTALVEEKTPSNNDVVVKDDKASTQLSLERLRNMTYKISEEADGQVELINGSYVKKEKYGETSVVLDNKNIAYSEDQSKVAVVLTTNSGGTGFWRTLVVLSSNNEKIEQVAYNELLEDRISIESLKFSGKQIAIKVLKHGPDDPSCCPSIKDEYIYDLEGSVLKNVSSLNTEDVSAWKTYENKEFGYSFEYPKNWVVRDLTLSNAHIVGLKSFVGVNPEDMAEDVYFVVKVTNNSLKEEIEFALKNITNNPNSELISDNVSTKFGSGGSLIKVKNKTTGQISETYYFEYKGSVYVVSGQSTLADNVSITANQIAQTFNTSK